MHIGFPKAGSTFLQCWFAAHPELAFAPDRLGGYRSTWDLTLDVVSRDEDHRRGVTSCEGFAIPMPRTRDGPIRLPPAGDEQWRVCDRLAGLFPAAEILIVTRGFRGAIVSSYSEYVRHGGTLDFAAFADGLPPRLWHYDAIIALYRARFGGRVNVLPYELLRDDPAGFLRVLADRLGLDGPGTVPGQVNPSLEPMQLAWYPVGSRLVDRLIRSGRLPRRAQAAWIRTIRPGRLRTPSRVLYAVRRRNPADGEALGARVLERFRGLADGLRNDPLYAPYLAEYLIEAGGRR